jgi:hypothetical protein
MGAKSGSIGVGVVNKRSFKDGHDHIFLKKFFNALRARERKEKSAEGKSVKV